MGCWSNHQAPIEIDIRLGLVLNDVDWKIGDEGKPRPMELSQDGTASEAPTATAGLTIAERGVAEVSKNKGALKVCLPNVVQAMEG